MKYFLKKLKWFEALLFAVFFSITLFASILFSGVVAFPLLKILLILTGFISGIGIGLFGFNFMSKIH